MKNERCIGCGLCVATCLAGAINLITKDNIAPLPEDREDLYRVIEENKKNRWERIKMLANIILKRKNG